MLKRKDTLISTGGYSNAVSAGSTRELCEGLMFENVRVLSWGGGEVYKQPLLRNLIYP